MTFHAILALALTLLATLIAGAIIAQWIPKDD